jgi:hypothetical protein
MKLYSGPKTTKETHTILREGFINDCKYKGISGIYLSGTPAPQQLLEMSKKGIHTWGIYLAGTPGAAQLLETTLPVGIDISSFEIFAPGAEWREWCVPADIINQYGKIRHLSESEFEQAWYHSIIETRKELTAEGVLEHAKDEHGKPVWRLTEKGRAIADQMEE